MQHIPTLLLSACTFGALCAVSVGASAQDYCPLYADNNWRLSLVEEAMHAWTQDQRGSTSFEPHLKFCRDVFRDDRQNARQILHDEWDTRHARIVERLASWSAQDMVGYLEAWPNRMSYICDIYADFNTALSEVAQHLDVDIGSLVESEHRDYCVNTIYQKDDQGLEVQEVWAGRHDYVTRLVGEHAAR